MDNNVVVNAVSMASGGALVVLRRFIDEIQTKEHELKATFIFYVPNNLNFVDNDRVKFVKIRRMSKLRLLYWHAFGFYWHVKNHIGVEHVAKVISLQNFDLFFPGRDRLVYFHQALILDYKNQNLCFKDRITFFLYRILYRITIITAGKIVVQNERISRLQKQQFTKRAYKINNINPYSLVNLNELCGVDDAGFPSLFGLDKILFYPAHYYSHKNHSFIVDAVEYLETQNLLNKQSFKIVLTISENDFWRLNVPEKLRHCFICLGNIPRSDVLRIMKKSAALVFPSRCETVGLPLLEAAVMGCNILVVDLPYARDILEGYSNCQYVDANNVRDWAHGMLLEVADNTKKPLQNVRQYPALLDLLLKEFL